jgi:hypothetical protein
VPLVVNGVEFVGGVLGGDVHTVLEHFWTQFDKRVERLVNPGCWGYSFRPNRNDPNSLSNHSSATAADGNAPKHPNGIEASRNFSRAQIAEVHQILAEVPELADVLHWGGDWHAPLRPDPMHAEIHGHDLAKLARVAQRIRDLEVDMTPAQDKLLNQIAKDAAEARRLAGLALKRGQVNSRAIVASRANDDAGFERVVEEIHALDAEEPTQP